MKQYQVRVRQYREFAVIVDADNADDAVDVALDDAEETFVSPTIDWSLTDPEVVSVERVGEA